MTKMECAPPESTEGRGPKAPISQYQIELLARARARIAKSQVRYGEKVAYPADMHLVIDLVAQIESLTSALEADAAIRAMPLQDHGWQGIGTPPKVPCQVEFFYGLARGRHFDGVDWTETTLVIAPYRDERRSLGYWDGSAWHHCGTGHEVYEFSDMPVEDQPTHWRALPPAPVILAEEQTEAT